MPLTITMAINGRNTLSILIFMKKTFFLNKSDANIFERVSDRDVPI